MNIEIFALCDAATDQQGKLNILGTFDTIFGRDFPLTHAQCALPMRIRFPRSEQGKHKISIHLIDEDGKFLIPKMEGNLDLMVPENQDSVAVNLVFNLAGLKFERDGFYEINLMIDDKQEASLPLQVKQIS